MAKYLDESGLDLYDELLKAKLATKAEVDGYYEELTAGNSEQLLATTTVLDKSPYVFRTSGGSLDIGDRCNMRTLIGGSVVWNQLVKNGNFADTSGWYGVGGGISVSNNVLTFLPSTFNNSVYIQGNILGTINGHKYLISSKVKFSKLPNTAIYIGSGGYQGVQKTITTLNTWVDISGVFIRETGGDDTLRLYPRCNGWESGDTVDIKEVMCIDLTAELGTAIANYIYTLESGTAGAGVAWFRKYFPEVYYAYSEPTIQSTKVSGKKVVGFNQWDEEIEEGSYNISTGEKVTSNTIWRNKNTIKIVPNTAYYTNKVLYRYYYDADMNYISADASGFSNFTTPLNAYYMNIRQSKSDWDGTNTNINLHWDGERDGEYEPYKSTTYDLSGSHLVTRKYEYRAYASGDESLPDTITDGTNTVTKRTTPITETVTNPTLYGIWKLDANNNLYFDGDEIEDFQNLQIVDDFGTEEFIDSAVSEGTRDVSLPAGHETEYYPNLRAKLEMSPNAPDSNGDYLMRHNNGVNTYVEYTSPIPALPSTNGTYSLKVTVSGSTKTLSWVAD